MHRTPPLNKEMIKNYVGLSNFQKGESYKANKAVRQGKIKNHILTALCQGHAFDPYTVEVIFDKQGINQSYCSCPVGAGGKCKHIAALLLTWLDYPDLFAEWEKIWEQLQTYDSKSLLELIDLLEEKVEGSVYIIHSFQQNLQSLQSPYLAKYLRRIEEAFQASKLPWYHPDAAEATEMAFSLGKIRSDTHARIEERQFSEAIQIHQSLIQGILNYLDEHDDFWGVFGEEIKGCIRELAYAFTQIPEDQELRQKIFQILFRLVEEQVYRKGDIGAEEARHVILEHVKPSERTQMISWIKAVQAAYKSEDRKEYLWLNDFLIDLEKERLDPEIYLDHYRQTGQIGKLIDSLLSLGRVQEAEQAARQQELISQVLPLANIFLQHQQEEIAEHLVLEAMIKKANLELLSWLKDFYLKRNRRDLALEQAMKIIHLSPRFTYYQEIQELAQSLGNWEQIRQEILDFLKSLNDQTLLVEIYLDEKDLARAIDTFNLTTFKTVGVFKDTNHSLLGLRLASAARHKYPHFAIQLYQEVVQYLIEERNRESYRQACNYLTIMREIYQEIFSIKDWNAYLKNFIQTYSRFRALRDEMRQSGLI